jgi:glycine dehydrogenase subunit 1
MSYISLSEKDRQEMLARIGVRTADELFGGVPGDVRLKRDLKVPGPLAELELIRKMESMAAKTLPIASSFLGGGPTRASSAVVDYLSQRASSSVRIPLISPRSVKARSRRSSSTRPRLPTHRLDVANASLYEGLRQPPRRC